MNHEPFRRRVFVIVGALFLFVAAPLAQAPAAPQVFDAVVANVMRTFEVPGMAVAVVKDGKTVLAKGYGVRRLGDRHQWTNARSLASHPTRSC